MINVTSGSATRRSVVIVGMLGIVVFPVLARGGSFSDDREAVEEAYRYIVAHTPNNGSSGTLEYRDFEGRLRFQLVQALRPFIIPAPFARGEWGALVNVQVATEKSDGEPYLYAVDIVGAGATYMAAYQTGLAKGWQRRQPSTRLIARDDLSFFLWVHKGGLNTPAWIIKQAPTEVETLKTKIGAARAILKPIAPNGAVQARAKSLGLAAFDQGDWAAQEGEFEEGWGLLKFGVALTDIALGLTPGVGIAKDAYECLTGTHLLTGNQLSDVDRMLALVGIFSLGFAGLITSGLKGAKRVVGATSAAKQINATTLRYIKHLDGPASVVTKRFGADANAEFIEQMLKDHPEIISPQPPWSNGRAVFDFVASRDFTVWRVHKEAMDVSKPAVGDWVMRVAPNGLTAAEVKDLYALPAIDPSALKLVSTLKIPKGTAMRVGQSGSNAFGAGGKVQWQVLDNVKPEWVIDTRAFP